MPSAIRVVDRFRDLADVNFTPGAGVDGYAMVYDHATGKLVPSASVLNAGLLDGLDSTAFALASHTHPLSALTQSGATTGQAAVWNGSAWAPGSAGVTDHGALTGLADDDHTQYVLVDGSRAMTGKLLVPEYAYNGGVSIGGATTANGAIRIESTGAVVLGPGAKLSGTLRVEASAVYTYFPLYPQYSCTVTPGYEGGPVLRANATYATSVPLTINLAAAQSANAINVTSSGGTAGDRFKVSAAGYLTVVSGTGSAGAHAFNWLNGGGFYSPATGATAFVASNTRECLRISEVSSAAAIGFLGATPVNRQALIADPTGGATVDAESRTAIAAINALLKAYGLEATS